MSRGVVTPVEPSNRPCWVSAAVCLAGPFFQDTITVCARLSALHRMKPAEPSASDLSSDARRAKAATTRRRPSTFPTTGRSSGSGRTSICRSSRPTKSSRGSIPELAEALFGTPRRPFSVSLEFPPFDGPDFERALGHGARRRPSSSRSARRRGAATVPVSIRRTRSQLRDLFEIVGRFDATDVLIDDRPVPYARELWLPLLLVPDPMTPETSEPRGTCGTAGTFEPENLEPRRTVRLPHARAHRHPARPAGARGRAEAARGGVQRCSSRAACSGRRGRRAAASRRSSSDGAAGRFRDAAIGSASRCSSRASRR